MNYLLKDVDSNSDRFSQTLSDEISQALAAGLANLEGFRASYRRVVSLQAWRVRVFDSQASDGVKALFLEAQNDALLSVVLAHMAMWRPALQSLRSCIESVLNACYYADHPVELQLWEAGRHRNDFSELLGYFSKHPTFLSLTGLPDVLAHIQREYSTLSRAVHASSISFHMTVGGNITITNSDGIKYRQWNSRHSDTLLWINLMLIALYSEALEGSQNTDVRRSISLVVPLKYHEDIASNLRVHLFSTCSS